MTATKTQMEMVHKWVHVWFEQGRGKGGVPKVVIHSIEGEDFDSLVKKSVAQMRIACEDSGFGHGKNLMPSDDWKDYVLHKNEGGVLEDHKGIHWVVREDKHKIANLILTWGLPSEHLMAEVRAAQDQQA